LAQNLGSGRGKNKDLWQFAAAAEALVWAEQMHATTRAAASFVLPKPVFAPLIPAKAGIQFFLH
jgi:hypothetical protein